MESTSASGQAVFCFFRLNAVAEQKSSPHKWDEVCTVDSPPSLFSHCQELEGHQQPLQAGARHLGHSLAQAYRGEGRLDDVPGPQVEPVFGPGRYPLIRCASSSTDTSRTC